MTESALDAVLVVALKRSKNPEAMVQWWDALKPRPGESREARDVRLDATYLSLYGEPRRPKRLAPVQKNLVFDDTVPF